MYPDLSYFFHDLLGTAPDNWTAIFKSFGMMLGIAFIACAWLVKSELRRLEVEGLLTTNIVPNPEKQKASWSEIIINGITATFLFAKIPYISQHFADFKGDPASIIFSRHGNWLLGIPIGLLYAGYLYYENSKKDLSKLPDTAVVHPYQKTMDIILIAAITGVLGSRLFSIFENMEDFLRDPLGQLFSGSGLTVYGGLILAYMSVYWYVKRNGIKPIYMMDIAGMGILLGYAIGRIGCQVAGDGDWGIVAAPQPSWWFLPDWLWSYHYPHNVSNDGIPMAGCTEEAIRAAQGTIEQRCQTACGIRYCHELSPKVYPTPVYETILSLIGFGILYFLRKKVKITGMLFCFYLIYNGVERFFIETIRVNEKYNLLGFNWSQAQYISIGLVLLGLIGIGYLYKKPVGWEK
jgi:phosphatidylglycerol---prolipoprotein diacylglyceryl transferase